MVPSEFVDAYAKLRKHGVVAFSKSAVAYLQRSGPRNRLIIKTIPRGHHLLRLYIRFGHRIRPLSFTDANPFKIIWIDPSTITGQTKEKKTPNKFGNVESGNWDKNANKFERNILYQSMCDRFLRDNPWEQTELYDQLSSMIDSNEKFLGREIDTLSDVTVQLDRIDELYESMNQNGYQTQRELYQTGKLGNKPHDAIHPFLNEIGVDIGRNGELYWRFHGFHRLAVAKILSVDAVGVQILNRHTEWQQLRNELRYGDPEHHDIPGNHPDLQDLLD